LNNREISSSTRAKFSSQVLDSKISEYKSYIAVCNGGWRTMRSVLSRDQGSRPGSARRKSESRSNCPAPARIGLIYMSKSERGSMDAAQRKQTSWCVLHLHWNPVQSLTFRVRSVKCAERKRKCERGSGGANVPCSRCERLGIDCEPSDGATTRRAADKTRRKTARVAERSSRKAASSVGRSGIPANSETNTEVGVSSFSERASETFSSEEAGLASLGGQRASADPNPPNPAGTPNTNTGLHSASGPPTASEAPFFDSVHGGPPHFMDRTAAEAQDTEPGQSNEDPEDTSWKRRPC